jgi:hypothetical protein
MRSDGNARKEAVKEFFLDIGLEPFDTRDLVVGWLDLHYHPTTAMQPPSILPPMQLRSEVSSSMIGTIPVSATSLDAHTVPCAPHQSHAYSAVGGFSTATAEAPPLPVSSGTIPMSDALPDVPVTHQCIGPRQDVGSVNRGAYLASEDRATIARLRIPNSVSRP